MGNLKRISTVLVIVLLMAGLASAETPVRGGTIMIAASDDWSTFDPFFQISLSNRIYNPMLFDTLIRIGDGVYEPGLATDWFFNEDRTEITLNLRQGVKFQDGRDFTAQDVVWNIERAMDTDAGYHITEFFADCTGVEALDDYTVVVSWAETSWIIEDSLSMLCIISPDSADEVDKAPIGTGPFALKAWNPGDKAEFVRNEYYWVEGQPYLDGVTVRIINDSQSRTVNLIAGDVDIIDIVSTQDLNLLSRRGNINIFDNAPPEYKNFSMNMSRAPFDNVLVRQAIAYSVDREAIRQMVYDGQGDVRYLPLVPNSKYYPTELEDYYTYDLDKAKALLAEAGLADGFTFTITVNLGIDGCLGHAEVLQNSLRQIGVNAIIEPVESASFFPKLTSHDFDMVSFGTGEPILDPSAYFSGAAVARTTRNFFGVTEDTFPRYTELIAKAASELDEEVRKQQYHEILEIQLEQSWTIPVSSTVKVVATTDKVQSFDVNNLAGNFQLQSVWLSK